LPESGILEKFYVVMESNKFFRTVNCPFEETDDEGEYYWYETESEYN